MVERSADWILTAATTTPTPWVPSDPEPPRRRHPTPTPSAAQCVTATWTAQQSFLGRRADVLVEIRAVNRCRRILRPTDFFFRIVGYRDGSPVQTAQGHPFREIFPGRSEVVTIGLPGSIDWYDEIVVEILD
jgi:hypothetical protein